MRTAFSPYGVGVDGTTTNEAGDIDPTLVTVTAPGRLRPRLAGLGAILDLGTLEPLLQRHRVNPEVVRDLLDRHSGLTAPRDTHHVITELARIGLGHSNILPGRPPGQARSDVTYSCSSPPGTSRDTPC